MATLVFFSLLFLLISLPFSYSSSSTLTKGSLLSVQNSDDVLISRKGTFSAGFYPVGTNSFCFAIWLTKKMHDGSLTVVWMANRDNPVNGKGSKIYFQENGNLVLADAGQYIIWSTNTISNSSTLELKIHRRGDLILRDSKSGETFWQSFNFPTDTILANQLITRQTSLVSSRSSTNHSSGFYKFSFGDDNILHLLFDGLDVSSTFWPAPWANSRDNGRSTNNNSRTAFFNSSGYFYATDGLQFNASDYGLKKLRRLKMDIDGNIRMYSLVREKERKWMVTWQAIQGSCKIHGICGANALCSYAPQESNTGRKCTCIPGYKLKNLTDWAYGCKPDFKPACGNDEATNYIELPHVEFYGYDIKYHENYTFQMCRNVCSSTCTCMGFQFKFSMRQGFYNCYPKSSLLNGYRSAEFDASMYIKLPKSSVSSNNTPDKEFKLDCSRTNSVMLERFYRKKKENATLEFMKWFATSVGGLELLLICIIWCYLYGNCRNSDPAAQGYLQVGSAFRKFTYSDMKKATKNFSDEIGRGSCGIVYKGILSDQRIAAIKRLNEANQGEAEFLAEVSTIGKLNHMNLIQMWGYCLEGKHRILVYEYMENGSLAKSLTSKPLDSKKRFNIAVGTARGLAYLHEECLEWVLHCDVKPQNVLLDKNFQPKVADFGLSKLFDRVGGRDSNFSKIRGTRGYMAPEWISNHAITSKVDVFSYGVVVLEMVTGKSPMGGVVGPSTILMEQCGLASWVRESIDRNKENDCGIEEIIDPIMEDTYDVGKIKLLVEVALQCVEEDKDVRPTMRQVVERLLQNEE